MAACVAFRQAANQAPIAHCPTCKGMAKRCGCKFRRVRIKTGKDYLKAGWIKSPVLGTVGYLCGPLHVHDFAEMVKGRRKKSLHHVVACAKILKEANNACLRKVPVTGLHNIAQLVGSLLRSICQITIDYLA